VQVYRNGLRHVVGYATSEQNLFPAQKLKEPRLLTRVEKATIWELWKRYLDYLLALDTLASQHRDFWRLKGETREHSFLIACLARVAKYRFTLELIERLEHDPAFDALLNEPVPELGLPAGNYQQLKLRFLNLLHAGEFAAWQAVYKTELSQRPSSLKSAIEQDAEEVLKFARGRGEWLTAKNAFQVIKDTGFKVWFPVQAGVSEWMGDTKVLRHGKSLISAEQIRRLRTQLEPGDILLERRD